MKFINLNKTDLTFTKFLVSHDLIPDNQFTLFDVGCSGGIDTIFRNLEPYLVGYGFDPFINEIKRLNGIEEDNKIKYYDYYILPEEDISNNCKQNNKSKKNNCFFERTSAFFACNKIHKIEYSTTFHDIIGKGEVTNKSISIDKFCEDFNVRNIDFLKTDTDGNDLYVLKSAKKSLEKVLALKVEANFSGIPDINCNNFASIDYFLRNRGFSLFKIESYNYSRSVLPDLFLYDIPAQTLNGQSLWAETYYLRDICLKDYEKIWNFEINIPIILKSIISFEIVELHDCLVEIVLNLKNVLNKLFDVNKLLDKKIFNLTNGKFMQYKDYIKFFHTSIESFYPKNYEKKL